MHAESLHANPAPQNTGPDRCLVCDTPSPEAIPGFPLLTRITSDCRPFRAGGRLAVCRNCGAVQKYPDAEWLHDISEIYSRYAAYYQGGGDEQVILDSRTGQIRRRSDVILERLTDSYNLPSTGKALDIGCGSGVTLSALSRVLPSWQLYGQDLDKRNMARLEAIPGFADMFDCAPGGIEGRYDLITLIHSLEHFPSPGSLLKSILAKLAPGGILLVQVCNTLQNPYDLLIADHLTHFSPDTLKLLAENSGYTVKAVETAWVSKELSMIAVNSGRDRGEVPCACEAKGDEASAFVHAQLKWLAEMEKSAGIESRSGHFGIFGTSICATWLAGGLGEKVSFFVDEDPSRQGKDYMGKPVLSPLQAPTGSKVYLALVPEIAAKVGSRLVGCPFQLIHPPKLNTGPDMDG